jgi:16S rRNA (uracil1498-N3)-methyltransferase
MQRFIVTDLSAAQPGDAVALSDDEAHHLRDVLRVRIGEEVELFDGRGWSCRAIVADASRRSVAVQATTPPVFEEPDRPALWMAVAPPKLDRLKWLVEKATELGVTRLIPLITERTVVTPGEGKLQRLEAVVAQACKQCGRNTLMQIVPPVAWSDFWMARDSATDTPSTCALVAHRDGQSLRAGLSSVPDRVVIVVGPEGGLTPAELKQATERGGAPTTFGRHILRIETAAIAAVAAVQAAPRGA